MLYIYIYIVYVPTDICIGVPGPNAKTHPTVLVPTIVAAAATVFGAVTAQAGTVVLPVVLKVLVKPPLVQLLVPAVSEKPIPVIIILTTTPAGIAIVPLV